MSLLGRPRKCGPPSGHVPTLTGCGEATNDINWEASQLLAVSTLALPTMPCSALPIASQLLCARFRAALELGCRPLPYVLVSPPVCSSYPLLLDPLRNVNRIHRTHRICLRCLKHLHQFLLHGTLAVICRVTRHLDPTGSSAVELPNRSWTSS